MSFYDILQSEAVADRIHRIVVGGVVKKEDKFILLERQSDEFMDGIFEIPSGKMEFGETIDNCLIRQIKEEIGCDIKKVRKYLGYFDYLSNTGHKVRQFNFLIDLNDNCDMMLSKEHKKIEYLTMHDCEFCSNISDELMFILNLASVEDSFGCVKDATKALKIK